MNTTPEAIAIYEEYPRKVAKPVAIRSIIRAISRDGFETVCERTKAYVQRLREVGRPMELIPHPSTFFNQARYMDDLDAALPLPQSSPTTTKPAVPLWQQIKATEALLEQNLLALKRSVFPNQLQYEWKNGHNAQYDHDYKLVFEKRQALKKHREELQKHLADLQSKALA